MHSHTNNRRRERESARGRDRAKEGSNRLPCTLFGRRTCPGTRGEGQWEQACESIEMQRARDSVHATLTVTGCCQLSRCLPPACKRPAPSSTTGRPIASYVVRADRHRLQHVSTAGSCIVSPSAARLWLLRGRTAAAAASLVWDIRFGVAVPKGESSTLGDCGYRAPRPVVASCAGNVLLRCRGTMCAVRQHRPRWRVGRNVRCLCFHCSPISCASPRLMAAKPSEKSGSPRVFR